MYLGGTGHRETEQLRQLSLVRQTTRTTGFEELDFSRGFRYLPPSPAFGRGLGWVLVASWEPSLSHKKIMSYS